MDKFLKAMVVGFATLTFIVVACVIGAYPTKLIVNYLFTPQTLIALFGVAKLNFWKALWLNAICASLFKGTITSK